ncbi:hypothetical protein L1987_07342 [Smallanthus sonchifolius]|uniref:Uncharacterized protein n=1 Tax=Smallanthus sonchifolius TaxID=185202 RepID=A0ACB9K0D2_9ASTR|nr:hypothetical protein L1987_07342 [Smallanthus sonchifolius]
MLDSDEYAVSQILESLKGNQTEEHIRSEEHEIEELNLDEVVKMASNINKQPSKSLKVEFKLPKKSRSDMHIADQSKVKRQKVSSSGRIIKEIYSSSNVKEVLADQPKVKRKKVSSTGRKIKEICSSNMKAFLADQPKVKRQKVSSSGKKINEICSSSNVKELLADQPKVKRQKVSSSGKKIKEICSSIVKEFPADQLKVKRQKVSSTSKTIKEICSSSNVKEFLAYQPKVKRKKASSTSKTIKEICSSSNVKEFQADQPKVNRQKVSSTDNTVQEICCSSNVKEFRSLRLRNPPKPFYNVLKCLSILQKKKVIDIGFGSLLEFNCAGIPSKLGHFVVDKFHANSMKLKLENGDIQITPELIQHIFGIPCGGTPVESLVAKDKKKECYVNWRSQFVKELRPSDILRRIEETEDDGIIFVLNFIILFLNSMVDCIPSGKCRTDVLERIDEDVDLKIVDWCGYIYKCLKKCKRGWKRDDIGSHFTGPITVLILIYLEVTSFKQLDTPSNVPAIKFWSVEMMKKRETLEIESGGFGRCEIKLSEKRVAKEESELEMIRVSADLDSKLASFLDAKIELEVLFTSAFRKFPDCQVLIEKKDFFYSVLINNDSKDDAVEAGSSSVKADQVDFVKVEQKHVDDMMVENSFVSDSGMG